MSEQPKTPIKGPKINFYWIYFIFGALVLYFSFFRDYQNVKQVSYKEFRNEMLAKGHIEKLSGYKKDEVHVIEITIKKAFFKDHKLKENTPTSSPQFYFTKQDVNAMEVDIDTTQTHYNIPEADQVEVKWERRANYGEWLGYLLPLLIMIAVWVFIFRRMNGGGGGQIFNFGRSKATLFEKNAKVNVTFKDVAGLDEAKVEVMEIVDFLKNPKKYTALGGKIPKGALLVGPPGTGKTLLAKAVAGEAQVPFFSLSGSDFVEMFVGVGASRVRDLFKQAREKAPCIIFIDEIDAVGRQRGKGAMMGGNDERENTLNQLLVEMDGFGTDLGIIIMAATNRPDVLDAALLRPGRFDRQISIDAPDIKGRAEIFKVHLRPLRISAEVDALQLAEQTPGFAGADIANVCNEAALIAARSGKDQIEPIDFNNAIDRVIGGLEKKNKIISKEEKQIVAYHEAGHAVVGWFLEGCDPLVKVSIVPRGVAALGYAQYLPKEQYLYRTQQLIDNMCMALGGRVAEEIFFGQVSTGAQNDLERVTRMAYGMVTLYGMNDRIGLVSFNDRGGEYQFHKPYSDETAKMIDEEVRKVIEDARNRTRQIIHEHREHLESIALELLDKEVIYTKDVERLIGKRPFNKTEEIQEAVVLENTPVQELPVSEETTPTPPDINETEANSTSEEPKNDE